MTAIPTKTSRITCLCGAICEPGSKLVQETFPIKEELCHCNPCRQTTGALAPAFANFKVHPAQETLDKCDVYESSTKVQRLFCKTCGTKVFVAISNDQGQIDHYSALAGCIERDPQQVKEGDQWTKDVIEVTHHAFLSDTSDGGLAGHLLEVDGKTPKL